jgi:hypothetical protein
MKKQKIKNLSLSKKTVSTLTSTHAIKGGESTNPGCLEPSGVSACLLCMEEPTEGCIPGGGTVLCLLTTACNPSAFC